MKSKAYRYGISLPFVTIVGLCLIGCAREFGSGSNRSVSVRNPVLTDRMREINDLSKRAYAELKSRDYAAAERDFKALLALDPHNPFRYRGLAMAYEEQGKTREAYNAWTKALRGRPGGRSSDQADPYVLARYGELCLKLNDRESAEMAFKAASQKLKPMFGGTIEQDSVSGAKLQSPRTLAHYNAGVQMCLGGQKEKARSELQMAVDLAPDWGLAKLALGTALMMQGKRSEAERLFQSVAAQKRGGISAFASTQARSFGLDRNMVTVSSRDPVTGKISDKRMTVDEYNRTRPASAPKLKGMQGR